jgi:hypothetical protein
MHWELGDYEQSIGPRCHARRRDTLSMDDQGAQIFVRRFDVQSAPGACAATFH